VGKLGDGTAHKDLAQPEMLIGGVEFTVVRWILVGDIAIFSRFVRVSLTLTLEWAEWTTGKPP
jgi:hypothetical protein